MTFDQAKYWRDRHAAYRGDPRSVGNMSATREANEVGERDLQLTVGAMAQMLGGRSVLDLGCGYGRIAGEFLAAGYTYRGLDVSPVAVETARGVYGSAAGFEVADLNAWDSDGQYDVVCALYIFVHFVDDANWRHILEQALASVAPGGRLVIADHFPAEKTLAATHVTTRPLTDYAVELARLGAEWDADFARDLRAALPGNPHARQFLAVRRLPAKVVTPAPQPAPAAKPAAKPAATAPAAPPALPGDAPIVDDAQARRAAMKRAMPKVALQAIHTQNARIVPTREAMLDALPKGGVAAEIGVAFGDFTREIMARTAPRQLYLIDLWSSERYRQGLDAIRAEFAEAVAGRRLVVAQGLSTERLPEFPDATFDWVYIDTDHSYDTTRDELAIARTKVKPGGRICGHDFTTGNVITPWPYGVIEAAHEFCVTHGWEYEMLSLDPGGHFSFCLRQITASAAAPKAPGKKASKKK